MKTKTKKSGFTLVELLVVIAIIGIISTIAVVNLRRSRIQAYAAAAMDNVFKVRFNIDLCHSEGGALSFPTPGDQICSLGAEYGQWPVLEKYTYIGLVYETSNDNEMYNTGTGVTMVVTDSDSDGLSWWWIDVEPDGAYNYRGDLYCYDNLGSISIGWFDQFPTALKCQWEFP